LMRENAQPAIQRQLGKLVGGSPAFLAAQSSGSNLRELMRWRAEILQQYLTLEGHLIDWEFSPRDPARKVRIGVLIRHFRNSAHTELTLAAYRHLDRAKFDVILIGRGAMAGEMEVVCKQAADRFVALPEKFAEQAGAIRELDLDVLLIGGDVVGACDGFTALAAHRLARMQIALPCPAVTTGMWNVDRFVCGPTDSQERFSERLLKLAGGTSTEMGEAILKALDEEPAVNSATIFAVAAIRNGGLELLPHWVEHYRKLGADELVIVVLGDAGRLDGQMKTIAAKHPFRRVDVQSSSEDSDAQRPQRQALAGCGAAADDWILWTDLDEFHEFPRPVHEMIRDASLHNCDLIGGFLLDHCAADGSLAETRADISLWKQYPQTGQVAGDLGASACKVMLAKFKVPVSIGHHHSPALCGHYDGRNLVHHFKWRAGLIERLEEGLRLHSGHTPRWQQETRKFLDRFAAAGNRITFSRDP
ncbi:MAG TPA: glycosyltransferase family 2 protein, partial [Tepidisphaeraceae bacterium]|nr:glycosyltransferase family 2 protein [Tepidisphaeraceae bacterium]